VFVKSRLRDDISVEESFAALAEIQPKWREFNGR
jgi:hypothetical protein